MSVRVPLPIRLLQASLVRLAKPDLAGNARTAPVFVYKPSGLPLFASSQVAAAGASSSSTQSHPRGSAAGLRSLLSITAGGQVSQDDASDSLFGRLEDTQAPGARAFLALNPVSPALLQSAPSSAIPDTDAVLRLLSREKGLVVTAPTQACAFFVRNAAQLGLVRQRFHVLCRLPRGVAENVRAHTRLGTRVGRRDEGWEGGGIPIWDTRTRALPASVAGQPSLLTRGSLFDRHRGALHRQARLVARVGVLSSTSRSKGQAEPGRSPSPRQRLALLFQPASSSPPSSSLAGRPSLPSGASGGHDTRAMHPWLSEEPLLTVLPAGDENDGGRERGCLVELDVTLLAVSDQAGNPLALYEVSSHQATAEDVRAIFHAEGCTVLNDFARDIPLAQSMQQAADAVRHVLQRPDSGVASLPMRTQHQLRQASPEALVWHPLVSLSTDAADRAALWQSQLCVQDGEQANSELSARVRRFLTPMPSSSSALDVSPRQLLWSALSRALNAEVPPHPTNTVSQALEGLSSTALARVLMLAFGSGVECCGVHLPDPAHAANVLAMQHLVNHLNSPRGGIAAHTTEHLNDVRAPMRMLSIGNHSGAIVAAPYGVSPVLAADERGASRDGATVPARSETQTCFTYACAMSLADIDTLAEDRGDAVAKVPLQWASSPAHVLSLTDVPAAFAPLVESWRDPRGGERAASRDDTTPSPLLLPPASRTRAVAARWLQAQTSHPGNASLSTERERPVHPLVLRVEEVAELTCAFCGARGHVWAACHQNCPTSYRGLAANQALDSLDGASVPSAGRDGTRDDRETPGAKEGEAAFAAQAARTVLQSHLVLRLDDAAAALADSDSESLHHHGATSSLTEFGDHDVVRVPNSSPTAPLNLHALRRERQKPAMHRRSVRCAYCHGQHHITSCPRLAEANPTTGSTANGAAADERESLTPAELQALEREAPEALFCIRCGKEGHLFHQCPRLPADVHPATHCLICLQSQAKTSKPHPPERCPRAVKPPAEFTARGVAKHALEERAAIVRERAARHRQKSRQRRGSMLVADGFIDSR